MSTSYRLAPALPFWLSLMIVPIVWIAAVYGGWTLALVPLATWLLFTILDGVIGTDASNADPQTALSEIKWHRAITLIWAPVQALTVFGVITFVAWSGHLSTLEVIGLAAGLGIMSGTIGIVYAHELMHQNTKLERWLGDILMTMVLYGHFRSEHLLVHHRYVGTPRDPVTARKGANFHRFFFEVVRRCFVSAWKAEAAMLARKKLSPFHRRNPFWRYAGLQLGFLVLAVLLGGWTGLLIFLAQAFVAVWQLELINYIEHYGLTRRHLGDGKYEHVQPHHSWNASQKASNWLLINLQRHSDHHYKPDRRFPLLQTYDKDEAPQLPYGYPVMSMMALVPRLWRKRMDPKVEAWRARHYPDIEDWSVYDRHATPQPR